MLTYYQNIIYMIVQLNYKMELNFHWTNIQFVANGVSTTSIWVHWWKHCLSILIKILHEYIDENLSKNFIRHLKSLARVSNLFVKKKDGSLCMWVDYYGLNKVTKKNHYPLSLISRLLEQFKNTKILTKINLRGTYNFVWVKEGDEWKTTFCTTYGHFEYLVMPFGLINALAVFQYMMNDIFYEYLDLFVIRMEHDCMLSSLKN